MGFLAWHAYDTKHSHSKMVQMDERSCHDSIPEINHRQK